MKKLIDFVPFILCLIVIFLYVKGIKKEEEFSLKLNMLNEQKKYLKNANDSLLVVNKNLSQDIDTLKIDILKLNCVLSDANIRIKKIRNGKNKIDYIDRLSASSIADSLTKHINK